MYLVYDNIIKLIKMGKSNLMTQMRSEISHSKCDLYTYDV